MSTMEKRSFTLPAEQASYIDAQVESGSYSTASDVIKAGIEALRERDAGIEQWLRKEVLPVIDATEADPGRVISADQMKASFQEHHWRRIRNGDK
jgi:antitoxin ParD1/3/4